MIKYLMGNVHVSATNQQVADRVNLALRDDIHPVDRGRALRAAVLQHRANQAYYRWVMGSHPNPDTTEHDRLQSMADRAAIFDPVTPPIDDDNEDLSVHQQTA